MPRRRKEPERPKPKRRPPNMGTVGVRANGRIFIILPKDLDPGQRQKYGPGGRQRFNSHAEATVWLDAEIVRRRTPAPGVTLDWTVRAYLAHWWTTNHERWPERTARNTLRTLRHALCIGDRTLRELLTLDPIRELLALLGRARWRRKKRIKGILTEYGPAYTYAPSTIKHVRSLLSTALEGVVPHVLPYNPVRPVRMAKAQDKGQPVWDAEQTDRFEAVALELRPELYFGFRLVLRRALRRGEVLAIKDDDLDMHRRVVTVDETAGDVAGEVGDTKGRKLRTIPLGDLAEDAHRHRLRRGLSGPWLFPSSQRAGKPLSLRQFNAICNQITDAAGLPRITPKDMRATAATILLDQNVALPRVSELLGHSSVAITARFYQRVLRPNQERLNLLADDFDRAFRKASEAVSESENSSKVSEDVSGTDATR